MFDKPILGFNKIADVKHIDGNVVNGKVASLFKETIGAKMLCQEPDSILESKINEYIDGCVRVFTTSHGIKGLDTILARNKQKIVDLIKKHLIDLVTSKYKLVFNVPVVLDIKDEAELPSIGLSLIAINRYPYNVEELGVDPDSEYKASMAVMLSGHALDTESRNISISFSEFK